MAEEKEYSTSEAYFLEWLSEMYQKGLVTYYSFESFTVLLAPENKLLKLKQDTYTSDFTFQFSSDVPKIKIDENLYEVLVDKYNFVVDEYNVCQVDVKARADTFVVHNSDALFPTKQKLVFYLSNVYINKVEIKNLFWYTFIPTSLLFNPSRGDLKKWFSDSFKPKKLNYFAHDSPGKSTVRKKSKPRRLEK